MLKNNNAFTLIEILLWILIFSMVIIWWFEALSAVTLWKIKLVEKADVVKNTFYFNEKLFEEIKKGWTIDYEEYFNRKVVWNTTYSSGHYSLNTWFWNFWNGWTVWSATYWNGFYYCRSTNWVDMWTWWCYSTTTLNNLWISNWSQRYMEYVLQFIDYNTNQNTDWWLLWDEDWDGNIRWDDDDENLWEWPTIFTGSTDVREIYLISWDKKKRTIFRWNWLQDPDMPNTGVQCDWTTTTTFWTGCLWSIEFLKLEWKDWGMSHNSWTTSTWSFDWIIDTWLIDKEFSWWAEIIAGSDNTNYRQPLFPNSVSVTDFKVFMYPNINRKYAWKNLSNTEVNPYLRIQISLSPSWKKRGWMKWNIPQLDISTTINLTDYFNK